MSGGGVGGISGAAIDGGSIALAAALAAALVFAAAAGGSTAREALAEGARAGFVGGPRSVKYASAPAESTAAATNQARIACALRRCG
jgi:hypothetical protein